MQECLTAAATPTVTAFFAPSLAPHQPFKNRTIPLAFRMARVCVCLVGFASMQSLWAFNFGHPCPSLVKGEVLSPEKIRATTGGIVLHPPTSPSPQPLQKDNNPSPHVCPFIQYVNHSQVCSPAHSSAFGTASPQDRYKAPK